MSEQHETLCDKREQGAMQLFDATQYEIDLIVALRKMIASQVGDQ